MAQKSTNLFFPLQIKRAVIFEFYQMDTQFLSESLSSLDFNLEASFFEHILTLLRSISIASDTSESRMTIFAATALAGEVQRMPSVSAGILVPCGLKIQNILQHIDQLSKSQFLQELRTLAQKWVECPVWLTAKIKKLNEAYGLFCHFKLIFIELSYKSSNIQDENINLLIAVFWITYLEAKRCLEDNHQCLEVQDEVVMISHIRYIFEELLCSLDFATVKSIIEKTFLKDFAPQKELYSQIKSIIIEVLKQAYDIRHCSWKDKAINDLIADTRFIARFIDDFAAKHQRSIRLQGSINQVCFLSIDKTLPPEAIRKERQEIQAITQKISFSEFEEDDSHSQSEDSGHHSTSFLIKQRESSNEFQQRQGQEKGYEKDDKAKGKQNLKDFVDCLTFRKTKLLRKQTKRQIKRNRAMKTDLLKGTALPNRAIPNFSKGFEQKSFKMMIRSHNRTLKRNLFLKALPSES